MDKQITKYFILAERNNQLKNSLPGKVYEIHSAELIKQPGKILLEICQFLHLTCEQRYIEDCSKIIFPEAKKTRYSVIWTDKQKELVREKLQKVPFLQNYSFEDWNHLCREIDVRRIQIQISDFLFLCTIYKSYNINSVTEITSVKQKKRNIIQWDPDTTILDITISPV